MAIALAASSKLVHARLRAQASQRAHRDAERHLLGSLAVRAAHPGMLSAELALADCLLLCTCWRSTQLVERPPAPPLRACACALDASTPAQGVLRHAAGGLHARGSAGCMGLSCRSQQYRLIAISNAPVQGVPGHAAGGLDAAWRADGAGAAGLSGGAPRDPSGGAAANDVTPLAVAARLRAARAVRRRRGSETLSLNPKPYTLGCFWKPFQPGHVGAPLTGAAWLRAARTV